MQGNEKATVLGSHAREACSSAQSGMIVLGARNPPLAHRAISADRTSNNPLEGSTDDGSSCSTRSWGGPHWNGNSNCSTANGGPYGTGSDTSSNSYWDTRNNV